jgi:hypothetical protein
MCILGKLLIPACAVLFASSACAADAVVVARNGTGKEIPYLLTFAGADYHKLTPKFITIAMPGGVGSLAPKIVDGKPSIQSGGNFLIRSRELFADEDFVAASTDATSDSGRMLSIVNDLHGMFKDAQIYIIGTSRSTDDTMELAESLDGKVAGFIHTSSMVHVVYFNPRNFKSRHLLVHHKNDSCNVTYFSAAESSHEKYGTPLIVMEGGISVGNVCQAFAYHGYNGIEKETVEKIKEWIRHSNL